MADGLGWDEAGLRQRCTDLRETLTRAGLASDEEIELYLPGGRENREPPPGDWIYCYANLVGMLRREETPAERVSREDAEAAVLAALRDQPEPVELLATAEDGRPRVVHVYPKSFDALCHIIARDRELLKLAAAAHALTESGLPENVEWGRRVMDEISYQERVMAWILTTPGAGLPFSPETSPAPPDDTKALEPADLLAIMRAHQRVNGARIGQVGDLLSRGRPGRRGRGPTWATLAATAASELGVSTRVLLRDWALAAWLAQLTLTADAKAEALEQARKGAARGH